MQTLMNSGHISSSSRIKTSIKTLIPQNFPAQPSFLKFPIEDRNVFKGSLKAVAEDSKSVDPRPFIVIDNYDSFTYNLCQCEFKGVTSPHLSANLLLVAVSPFFLGWTTLPVYYCTSSNKAVILRYQDYRLICKLAAEEQICPEKVEAHLLQSYPTCWLRLGAPPVGACAWLPKRDGTSGWYVGELGTNFEVHRNDEISVEDLKRKNPKGILISPGPGTPQDSGISLATVLELGSTIPIFGVCMGLQCIGEAFGGKVVRSPYGVMHGKSSPVYYDEKRSHGLFSGLPNPFTAARYHSLVVTRDGFPDELEITAWTEDGLVMAAHHKEYPYLQGVQFHPESVLTPEGKGIIKNFIRMIESGEKKDSL
ncbi:Anthranilate synthase beta subunit 1 chloroplastic [Bienertia sinuspersici]